MKTFSIASFALAALALATPASHASLGSHSLQHGALFALPAGHALGLATELTHASHSTHELSLHNALERRSHEHTTHFSSLHAHGLLA
jgi:hypothetical protein